MRTSALLVLAATFSTAFVGRLAVLASDLSNAPPTAEKEDAGTASASGCLSAGLAASLHERLNSLEAEEMALADKKSALKAYEWQIEKRLGELKEAQEIFADEVSTRREARDADIAKLAAIYEGMKPAQASAIIGEMDPKFAAGLLGAMSSEQAAAVVATMDTDKAYLVSVILANRSQSD